MRSSKHQHEWDWPPDGRQPWPPDGRQPPAATNNYVTYEDRLGWARMGFKMVLGAACGVTIVGCVWLMVKILSLN
jgi:hypothetical protein